MALARALGMMTPRERRRPVQMDGDHSSVAAGRAAQGVREARNEPDEIGLPIGTEQVLKTATSAGSIRRP